MGTDPVVVDAGGTAVITVRYWAGAREAAGVASEEVIVPGPVPLSELTERVLQGRPERMARVIAICSVLVGDRPVGAEDPGAVVVHPGESVEFLPPFAGG